MKGIGLARQPPGELRSQSRVHVHLLLFVFTLLCVLGSSFETVFAESNIVSGELIVHYRRSGNRERHQNGRFLKRQHKIEAVIILKAAGVNQKVYRSGNFYRPIHEGLIKHMKTHHLREPLAHLQMLAAVAEKKDTASARFEALAALAASPPDYDLSRELVINLPREESVEQAVQNIWENQRLLRARGIELIDVTPNVIVPLSFEPNDVSYNEQYALRSVNASTAWDRTRGRTSGSDSRRIIIAILDTGVDYNHPDLAANIWSNLDEIPNNGKDDDNNGKLDDVRGWDFIGRDNSPLDAHGHGTHCSGIAAGVTNNGRGIAGICPECLIMPLRAGDGSLPLSAIKEGIIYAQQNGADVLSMSFGSTGVSSMNTELQAAANAGVVLVAAAGNGNSSQLHYPAAYNRVISVASVDSADRRSSFSQYGSWVDVAAPGSAILSTLPGNKYAAWNGTSMAGPYVAGLAGLVLSQERVTASQMQDYLRSTVRVIPGLTSFYRSGFGIIDASKAVVADEAAELGIPVIERPLGDTDDSTPTVSWSSVLTATGYDLEVERISDSTIVYSKSSADTSATVSPALTPGAYCARVRATAESEEGQYSSCADFVITEDEEFASPSIVTPIGSLDDTTPTLSWTAVVGASRYDVRVLRMSDEQIVYSRNGLSGRQTAVFPALANGSYCTQARARSATETSAYSVCRMFSIQQAGGALGIPSISSPNGTIQDSTPQLAWSSVKGATSYDVSLLRLSDEKIVFSRNSVTSTSVNVSSILGSGSYCTRVRAKNGSATGLYSDCKQFEIDVELVPEQPRMIGPSGIISDSTPTFSWHAADVASRYTLVIQKNGKNLYTRSNVSGTQVSISISLPNGSYTSKVKAISAAGKESTYSEPLAFSVSAAQSSVTTIVAPTSGQAIGASPTFRWLRPANADRTRVWVRRYGQSKPAIDVTVSGLTYIHRSKLSDGTYKFYARSYRGTKAVTPWVNSIFTVDTYEPPAKLSAPVITAPTGVVTDATPTFRWNADSRANRHFLHVIELARNKAVISTAQLTATNFTPPKALRAGRYRVYVRSYGSGITASSWSSSVTFEVTSDTNEQVTLSRPVILTPEGTTLRRPMFSWLGDERADSTYLWVNDESRQRAGVIKEYSLSGAKYTTATNLLPGTYKVWVKSLSSRHRASAWSVPRTFIVE